MLLVAPLRTPGQVASAILLAGFMASRALAQVPAQEPALQQAPSRMLPLPDFPREAPTPDFRLPPMAPPPGEFRFPGAPKFFVRRIELEGNTVFSTELLRRELLGAYENRELSSEELQDLRHRLSLYYVERGYVNSGAIIPDQKIDGGIVRLRIIEGRLTDIEITGNRALRTEYLRDRLYLDLHPPLNVNELRERMQVMQQDPMIGRINAELVPGAQPGEALLRTRIEENEPVRFGVSFANNRSPAIGSERGEIQVGDMSLTGRGDPLSVRVGKTKGLTDYSLSYALPLTARDLQLRIRADHNHSVVLEQPFNVLDIKSRSEALSVGLSYPLIRTPWRELQFGVYLEHRKSSTSLLGSAFSFSPGVQDGRSVVSALRLSQEWIARDVNQILAARSTFSFGLDLFNATINENAPDGRFAAWLGQAQWIRQLDGNLGRIVLRGDAQLSHDPLLPLEKFSVGGAMSVRGYRENQFVRDNGVALSAEYRYPLVRVPLPDLTQGDNEGWVELAPFFDAGASRNFGGQSVRIASVGLGLRWEPMKGGLAQLYFAKASPRIHQSGPRNLQDKGVHFLVSFLRF